MGWSHGPPDAGRLSLLSSGLPRCAQYRGPPAGPSLRCTGTWGPGTGFPVVSPRAAGRGRGESGAGRCSRPGVARATWAGPRAPASGIASLRPGASVLSSRRRVSGPQPGAFRSPPLLEAPQL